MIHYIYRIVNNKNNKSYIGYTINPKRRWSAHKYIARTGKGYLLHDAIRHDGIENFEFNILFESEDRTLTLTKMEKYYIEQFDSKANGYNSTIGGAGTLGWVPSAKTRELWSNQRTGHKHSEEFKANVSKRMKDNPLVYTDEMRRSISERNKATGLRPPSTPEIIEKIRIANTGKKRHSKEWKDMLSEKLKNKPLLSNPESLAKQKRNKIGKGCGERNGRAKFCSIYSPTGELFCSGYLRKLCNTHDFPFNTFSENSKSPKPMVRGNWIGWNVVNIPRPQI